MKKLVLPILMALFIWACEDNSGFTVKGTSDQEGELILITPNGNSVDTLGSAQVVNGKFSIKGSVDNITTAFLRFKNDVRGGGQIILENATYTVDLKKDNPMPVVNGPAEQQILNQYTQIFADYREKNSEFQMAYQAAAGAGDEARVNEIIESHNKLVDETQQKEKDLIKANPDSYAITSILVQKMRGMEYDELQETYNSLGENAKNNKYGKEIAEYLTQLKSLQVGEIAPDFTLPTPEGNQLSLYDVKGKVKIIDFWASWCGPCRNENPNVVKLYKKYHKKGLEILGVSLDRDKDAWLKAIKDDQLTWKHVSDLKFWESEAAKLYAVRGIPHIVILDGDNRIIAKNLRGEELEQKVAELLK